MRNNSFVRKQRQLINLSKRLTCLLESGKWEQLQESIKIKLIARLNSLYHLLQNYFSFSVIKKMVSGAIVFIAFPLISRSQTFEPPVQNPFGYEPGDSSFISPVFADIDGDEDLDLFVGKYGPSIQFYQNTGSKTSPVFAAPQHNPYGLVPVGEYIFLATADIDNDGDIDLFTGSTDGKLRFFKNAGTKELPAFAAPVINPFGFTTVNEFCIPAFADIDNDSDLDLFVCEYEGEMKYFENNGSPAIPHFKAPIQNPFGITPAYAFGAPVFADLDFDGDLDLLEGEYYGNTRYFENTGSVSSPAFALPLTNPFGIVQTVYYSMPAIADIDGDGDIDVFIGEAYSNIKFFKNTDFNVGVADFQPSGSFELYPNPAKGEVLLSLSENYNPGEVKIQLFETNGRLISERKGNSLLTKIDLSQLLTGVYIVRLVSKEGVLTKKLVVE